MLETNIYPLKTIDIETQSTHSRCDSQSSFVSSYSLSAAAFIKIKEIKNTQTSRCKLITRSITSSITSFFKSLVKKITRDDLITRTESDYLIGITIDPFIARKYENRIEFNHTGKINSLKKGKIKKQDYHVLINNMIKPLNESPAFNKNRMRTPGEAVIDIAGLIVQETENLVNSKELEEIIKSTWLDGALSRQSLYNMTALIKIKIGHNPRLINEINNIIASLEKDFFITKRNDNYYGRLFETELSKYIIKNPDMNMLNVRNAVSAFILEDFNKMSKEEQLALCDDIAVKMDKDPPAWRDGISSAGKFIYKRKPEYFIEMLNYLGEYSVPLILSTAVKYIISANGTIDLKNEATRFYNDKILPQRKVINRRKEMDALMSTTYGLLLPYQKNLSLDNDSALGRGIRPIDKYIRPTAGIALTEHDAIALTHERTIGIGMSGSSNILNFLFRKLQLLDKLFPIDDAKLATAAWLSYSGGHSFNEAYSVFNFMSEGNFKPLSFNALKISSHLSEKAITHSYCKVIEASIELNDSTFE